MNKHPEELEPSREIAWTVRLFCPHCNVFDWPMSRASFEFNSDEQEWYCVKCGNTKDLIWYYPAQVVAAVKTPELGILLTGKRKDTNTK